MTRFAFISGAMLIAVAAGSVRAELTTFNYTQSDTVTGAGIIAPFTVDDGGGPITFSGSVMPAANIINPNPTLTPPTFVGAQTTAAGASNEADSAVGLAFSGIVTAFGARGTDLYSIQIPLKFVPKQTQDPDVNDYTWSVTYGDSLAQDAASTPIQFAMYLSRDDVVDAMETAGTFQRYTQNSHTFAAGALDAFTNTDTTTTPIKDALDSGNPAGDDAVGRDLAFYFGWRQNGELNSGAILIDEFTIGGLLEADETTLTLIPEPSSALLAVSALGLLATRRRRSAR